jgi:hypothetical protein
MVYGAPGSRVGLRHAGTYCPWWLLCACILLLLLSSSLAFPVRCKKRVTPITYQAGGDDELYCKPCYHKLFGAQGAPSPHFLTPAQLARARHTPTDMHAHLTHTNAHTHNTPRRPVRRVGTLASATCCTHKGRMHPQSINHPHIGRALLRWHLLHATRPRIRRSCQLMLGCSKQRGARSYQY